MKLEKSGAGTERTFKPARFQSLLRKNGSVQAEELVIERPWLCRWFLKPNFEYRIKVLPHVLSLCLRNACGPVGIPGTHEPRVVNASTPVIVELLRNFRLACYSWVPVWRRISCSRGRSLGCVRNACRAERGTRCTACDSQPMSAGVPPVRSAR